MLEKNLTRSCFYDKLVSKLAFFTAVVDPHHKYVMISIMIFLIYFCLFMYLFVCFNPSQNSQP